MILFVINELMRLLYNKLLIQTFILVLIFQTSLLLMKNLNKTETLIFLSLMCSLFSKAIF